MIKDWIARHTTEEVIAEFERSEAAVAPVYDCSDPHFSARSIVSIPDDTLGQVKMQNVLTRMADTPAQIRCAGPDKGTHNEEILHGELGIAAKQLEELKQAGIV